MRLIDGDALFDLEKARHDFFDGVTYIGDKARRDEITNFMADIKNSPTVNGWVSVKDRLPDKPCGCLVFNIYGWRALDFWEGDGWAVSDENEITHWMPLPPGPEVKDE